MLPEHDTVQPNLVFVSNERSHIITRANIQGAPDLLVEILPPSTARQDWRSKFDLYERRGVLEYWMIDPESRGIWVFLPRDGVFEEVGRYGDDDTLTSPTLEGFSVELSTVSG